MGWRCFTLSIRTLLAEYVEPEYFGALFAIPALVQS